MTDRTDICPEVGASPASQGRACAPDGAEPVSASQAEPLVPDAPVVVTPEDEAAAAEWSACLPGNFPMELLEQSFARHRTASQAELLEALEDAEALLEEQRPFDDIEACQTFPYDRTAEDEDLLYRRREIRATISRARGNP